MPFKKGERITDPNVLQRLAKARAKALETRRANAARKRDEKALAKLQKQKEHDEVKKKLASLKGSAEKDSTNIQMEIKEVKKDPEPSPPEESEKKVEEKVSIAQKPKKVKKKRKKRVVLVTDSSDDENEVDASHDKEAEIIARYKERERKKKVQFAQTPPRRQPAPPRRPPPQKSRQEHELDAIFAKCYGRRR